MPEISRFLGIVVKMYDREHGPPHFHAHYGEYEVVVHLWSGVVQGRFPPHALRNVPALRSVMERYDLHRVELHATGSSRKMEDHSHRSIRSNSHLFVHVVEARYLGGYRVRLRFHDGLEGELDLESELHGEVFEPLRDPGYFASFVVDDTLTWGNGADFAPEYLHERLASAQSGRR